MNKQENKNESNEKQKEMSYSGIVKKSLEMPDFSKQIVKTKVKVDSEKTNEELNKKVYPENLRISNAKNVQSKKKKKNRN